MLRKELVEGEEADPDYFEEIPVMHPKMIRAMVMRSVKTNSWL